MLDTLETTIKQPKTVNRSSAFIIAAAIITGALALAAVVLTSAPANAGHSANFSNYFPNVGRFGDEVWDDNLPGGGDDVVMRFVDKGNSGLTFNSHNTKQSGTPSSCSWDRFEYAGSTVKLRYKATYNKCADDPEPQTWTADAYGSNSLWWKVTYDGNGAYTNVAVGKKDWKYGDAAYYGDGKARMRYYEWEGTAADGGWELMCTGENQWDYEQFGWPGSGGSPDTIIVRGDQFLTEVGESSDEGVDHSSSETEGEREFASGITSKGEDRVRDNTCVWNRGYSDSWTFEVESVTADKQIRSSVGPNWDLDFMDWEDERT